METKTATKIILIAKRAKEDKKLKFISLMHHINEEFLFECFKELKQGKAAGVDHKTKESYTDDQIKKEIHIVVEKIRTRKYQPQPVRRTYINKEAGGKPRPLGIPTVIDRTVQLGIKKLLEAIYEPNLLNCSFGYRPNRNAHQALKAVNHLIMQKKVNWIIDADIKGFFDNVDHKWMMECLSQRIKDPRFKSLIYRFLKSGVLEENEYYPTLQGTPQGGIISPILANIYLHYILDLWFNGIAKKEIRGEAQLIRYADDFIIGVEHKDQAIKLQQMIQQRLAKFNLTLSEEKTKIIEFGRFARENCQKRNDRKPQTFDFLGFTHYCSTTKDSRFRLGTKTSKKKMNKSLKANKQWLKSIRNQLKQKEIWQQLKAKLQGHYNYYGISGNFPSIKCFYDKTVHLTFKWLNRRSQKKSFNWSEFDKYLKCYPLPKPKLMFQIYNTW